VLKQEDVTKRIEAARKTKPWLDNRMDRLATLDKSTRAIGQRVLGYDDEGKRREVPYWNFIGVAARHMKPRAEADLLRLGEALFPCGENETVVTAAALAMRYSGGLSVLMNVLQAVGRDPKLERTYIRGLRGQLKSCVFSHLLRSTRPSKDNTPQQFASAVKTANISEHILCQLQRAPRQRYHPHDAGRNANHCPRAQSTPRQDLPTFRR
jgi:hypothetical protein